MLYYKRFILDNANLKQKQYALASSQFANDTSAVFLPIVV